MILFLVELIIVCLVVLYLNGYLRKTLIPDLKRKNVFITGTDSGFGRRLALDLDRQGLTVYAGCLTTSGAESLRQEASSKLRTFQVDVTDNDSIISARDAIGKDLVPGQGLWAIVNNAGIARGVVFEMCSLEDYETTMNVNFYGVIRVTNAFLPLVKEARGRIVNVVSILGRFSLVPGPYCCSKFAAESYSDGLRRQLQRFGVKVSIIEPGFYRTDMTSAKTITADVDRVWGMLPDEQKKEFGDEYQTKVKDTLARHAACYPLAHGNKIHQVTESIQHAIGSQHPKARYVCGLDAHLMYRPASIVLPDWLSDFSIRVLKKVG